MTFIANANAKLTVALFHHHVMLASSFVCSKQSIEFPGVGIYNIH